MLLLLRVINMKKNFKLFINYVSFFMFVLLTLILLQNLVIRIPNSLIDENIKKSATFYKDNNDIETIAIGDTFFSSSVSIHYYSDCITLNMISNLDPSHSFKSQVLMNYYDGTRLTMCEDLYYSVNNNVESTNEYSRYWHGSIVFIKPLLVFFNVHTIKTIFVLLFFGLLAYLIYLIVKKSNILAVLLSVSLVSVMIYIVPFCFEYVFAFLITIFASIIVMKNLDKKNEFFYKFFVVLGITSCFFDFLAYEVLTLMFPLFLKIYFDNFDKEDINLKKVIVFIIKSMFIWGISYILTFVFKWIMSAMVLGVEQFVNIWNNAKIRIYDTPFPWYLILLQSITYICSMIFPFSLFEKGIVYFILYCLIIVYLFVNYVPKNKRKYLLLLLLVSLIGLLRLVVLFAHTWGHYFFDYRNLFPLILWSLLVLYESFRLKKNN